MSKLTINIVHCHLALIQRFHAVQVQYILSILRLGDVTYDVVRGARSGKHSPECN